MVRGIDHSLCIDRSTRFRSLLVHYSFQGLSLSGPKFRKKPPKFRTGTMND